MNSKRVLLLCAVTVPFCWAALYGVSGLMMHRLLWKTATPAGTVSTAGSPRQRDLPFAAFPPMGPATPGPATTASVTDPAAQIQEKLRRQMEVRGALKNEAIVSFKTPEAYAAFLQRAAAAGLVILDRSPGLRSVRVGYDSLARLASDVAAHAGDYDVAGPNFAVQAPELIKRDQPTGVGDVPYGDQLLSSLGATPNIDRSKWGTGVTVAVLDSGVSDHPAFTQGQVTHLDLVNDGSAFNGHGTAIASLIAGNAPGAEGLAPASKILDVRVADTSGASNSFLLAQGIMAAVQNGAQVINISMGSEGDAPAVAQAVQTALAKGVVIVASAGNEDLTTKDWPAAYPGVISVSGVDAAGHLAYFSNAGSPTLAAPAVGVPSAYAVNGQPYMAVGDGTSQASALVSGAAAAIAGGGGDVYGTLIKNARSVSAPATDVGAGVLHLPTGK